MRLKNVITLPIDLSLIVVGGLIVATWWMSIPRAERKSVIDEIKKFNL